MELWERAEECCDRATETEDVDKAVELLDMATVLYLKAAEGEETEESRLILTKDARMAEGNKYLLLANNIVVDAPSGSEQAKYFREIASYLLPAHSSIAEAAEISEEQGDIASYHTLIGGAYHDRALYHHCLANASEAVFNWDEALSAYKESLPLLESAVEHFDESLRMKFDQDVEYSQETCIEHIESCEYGILEAESRITGVKTTGTPSLSVDMTADNLRQDTYSRVMLRIVNGGDGVAKDVKIRLDAPVEGETAASLEIMKQECETGLALSVKPLEHGRMKFTIYAEYMDMQGRKDAAIGETWVQVARLTKEPAAQQVFHIESFTGEIGRGKQVAGGRTK